MTFPGTAVETPIALHLVENGTVAPGQRGSSPAEVKAVVDLVLAQAEQCPDESLGVIAMGSTHVEKVDTAVRQAVQDRPDLREFFAEDASPGRRFFVKNLARVQGDERDVIILALGVGKRSGGRLDGRSFGPLNSEGGRRRLNVAVTAHTMTVIGLESLVEGLLLAVLTERDGKVQQHGFVNEQGRKISVDRVRLALLLNTARTNRWIQFDAHRFLGPSRSSATSSTFGSRWPHRPASTTTL